MRQMNETEFQFKNVADAVRYLEGRSWQISEKTLYRHVSQGKVKNKPWTQDELDAYGAEYLRPISGAPVNAASAARLPRGAAAELLTARKRKLETDVERAQLQLEFERGNLIPRDVVERALARRALFFRNSLENWLPVTVDKIINLVGGDPLRTPDVVSSWNGFVDELLAGYVADFEKELRERDK